jgi:hypothetical protein
MNPGSAVGYGPKGKKRFRWRAGDFRSHHRSRSPVLLSSRQPACDGQGHGSQGRRLRGWAEGGISGHFVRKFGWLRHGEARARLHSYVFSAPEACVSCAPCCFALAAFKSSRNPLSPIVREINFPDKMSKNAASCNRTDRGEMVLTASEDLSCGQNAWDCVFGERFDLSATRNRQSVCRSPVIRHAARPSTPTGSPVSAGAGLRLSIKRNSSIMSFRMRRNAR